MIAEVRLWGRTIGAVSTDDGGGHATFQYTAEFSDSGIQVAPLMLPLSRRVYEFPELPAVLSMACRACSLIHCPTALATH